MGYFLPQFSQSEPRLFADIGRNLNRFPLGVDYEDFLHINGKDVDIVPHPCQCHYRLKCSRSCLGQYEHLKLIELVEDYVLRHYLIIVQKHFLADKDQHQ